MKLLFVCTENKLRSPTAEAIFSAMQGIEAISAGTNKDAETVVSGDLIAWADIIFVMEKIHRQKVARKFTNQLKNKKLVNLDVPDNYAFMAPELVTLLRGRVGRYLNLN